MYTTYVTPTGPGGSPGYHMCQAGGGFLIGGRDQCVQGATPLRNRRVWTQEKRDQFIAAANERARSMYADPSTLESSNYDDDASDSYPVEDSQTSIDDFAATPFAYPANDPNYDGFTDVAEEEYEEEEEEEDEIYADEPTVPTYTKPIAS
jgi:hypothetical protein